MATYTHVLRVREFRVLLTGHATTVAGRTMQQLALASLVYAATRSPLLAAVTYLAGLLPQAVVALTVLSLADRLPPRGALVAWDATRAAIVCVLAVDLLPLWALLVVVLAAGTGDALLVAVRQALVADVLTTEHYVQGRALMNTVVGLMQITGFAVGGVLLALLSPHGALWVTAGLALLGALITWTGLRPRTPRGTGRGAVRATWAGNRALFADRRSRGLLLAHWLPNGLIVGAEALYVPHAGHLAGLLFVTAGLGMLLGDVVVGRLAPRTRGRLILPLSVLLAAPYLAFLWRPPTAVAAVFVAVASFGFASTLGVQERLLAVVPEGLRGQTLGLATSGMMSAQAVAAAVTGVLAEAAGTAAAMALAGAGSLLLTSALAPHVGPAWRARGAAAAPVGAGRRASTSFGRSPCRRRDASPTPAGQPVGVSRMNLRRVAAEDFVLRPGEEPYDLVFAVRVGALDGRHPDLGKRIMRRLAVATTAGARLFIDGGDSLRELPIPRPRSEWGGQVAGATHPVDRTASKLTPHVVVRGFVT